MPKLKATVFPSPIRVASIAKVTGLSIGKIREYNPHIKGAYTPPSRTYRIWLPESLSVDQQAIAAVPKVKLRRVASAGKTYKVRRGDTLGKIARKFRVSLPKLKKLNNLRGHRIYPGQKLKLVLASAATRYKVRRGDNLFKIGRRFGVSVGELRRLNSMRSSRIFVGQTLLVKIKA